MRLWPTRFAEDRQGRRPPFFRLLACRFRSPLQDNLTKLAPESGEVLCPPGTLLFSGVFLRAWSTRLARSLHSKLGLRVSSGLPMLPSRSFIVHRFIARTLGRVNR